MYHAVQQCKSNIKNDTNNEESNWGMHCTVSENNSIEYKAEGYWISLLFWAGSHQNLDFVVYYVALLLLLL